MKKSLLFSCLLALLSSQMAHAQVVSSPVNASTERMKNHMLPDLIQSEIDLTTQEQKMIGKKLVAQCLNLTPQQTCADKIKEKFKINSNRVLRIVPYGSPVTMDFSSSRLTVSLDQEGKITTIKVG